MGNQASDDAEYRLEETLPEDAILDSVQHDLFLDGRSSHHLRSGDPAQGSDPRRGMIAGGTRSVSTRGSSNAGSAGDRAGSSSSSGRRGGSTSQGWLSADGRHPGGSRSNGLHAGAAAFGTAACANAYGGPSDGARRVSGGAQQQQVPLPSQGDEFSGWMSPGPSGGSRGANGVGAGVSDTGGRKSGSLWGRKNDDDDRDRGDKWPQGGRSWGRDQLQNRDVGRGLYSDADTNGGSSSADDDDDGGHGGGDGGGSTGGHGGRQMQRALARSSPSANDNEKQDGEVRGAQEEDDGVDDDEDADDDLGEGYEEEEGIIDAAHDDTDQSAWEEGASSSSVEEEEEEEEEDEEEVVEKEEEGKASLADSFDESENQEVVEDREEKGAEKPREVDAGDGDGDGDADADAVASAAVGESETARLQTVLPEAGVGIPRSVDEAPVAITDCGAEADGATFHASIDRQDGVATGLGVDTFVRGQGKEGLEQISCSAAAPTVATAAVSILARGQYSQEGQARGGNVDNVAASAAASGHTAGLPTRRTSPRVSNKPGTTPIVRTQEIQQSICDAPKNGSPKSVANVSAASPTSSNHRDSTQAVKENTCNGDGTPSTSITAAAAAAVGGAAPMQVDLAQVQTDEDRDTSPNGVVMASEVADSGSPPCRLPRMSSSPPPSPAMTARQGNGLEGVHDNDDNDGGSGGNGPAAGRTVSVDVGPMGLGSTAAAAVESQTVSTPSTTPESSSTSRVGDEIETKTSAETRDAELAAATAPPKVAAAAAAAPVMPMGVMLDDGKTWNPLAGEESHRVAVWDRKSQKMVGGLSAPMRRELRALLENGQYEIYTGQDEKHPGPVTFTKTGTMSNDPRGRGRGRPPISAAPAVLLPTSPKNHLPNSDQAAKTRHQRSPSKYNAVTRRSSSALGGAGAAESPISKAASARGDGASRRVSLRLKGSGLDKPAVTTAVCGDGNGKGSAGGGRRGRSNDLGQGVARAEPAGIIDRDGEEKESVGGPAHAVAGVGLRKRRDGDEDGDGGGGERVSTRDRLSRRSSARDGARKEGGQTAATAGMGSGRRSGVSKGGGGGSGELPSGTTLGSSRKCGRVSGTDGGSTGPSLTSTLRSSGKGAVRRSCSAVASDRSGQEGQKKGGRHSLGAPRKSASTGTRRLARELTAAPQAATGKEGVTTAKAGTSHRDGSRGGAAGEETARAAAMGGGEQRAISKKRARKRMRLQGEPWVAMWAQGFSDEDEAIAADERAYERTVRDRQSFAQQEKSEQEAFLCERERQKALHQMFGKRYRTPVEKCRDRELERLLDATIEIISEPKTNDTVAAAGSVHTPRCDGKALPSRGGGGRGRGSDRPQSMLNEVGDVTEQTFAGGTRRNCEEAGSKGGGPGGPVPSPLDESAGRNGFGSTGETGEGSESSGAAEAEHKGKMMPSGRRRSSGRLSANTTAVSCGPCTGGGAGDTSGSRAAGETSSPSLAGEGAGAGGTGADENADRAVPSMSLSALEDGYHNRLTCTICSSGAELRPVTLTGGWGRGSVFTPPAPQAAALRIQPAAAAAAATAAAVSLRATQSLLADHLSGSTLPGSSATCPPVADGKDGGRSGPVDTAATAVSLATASSSFRSGPTSGGGRGADSSAGGGCRGGEDGCSSATFVNGGSTMLDDRGTRGGKKGKPLPLAVVNEATATVEAMEATADGYTAVDEEGAGALAAANADDKDGGGALLQTNGSGNDSGEMAASLAARSVCGASISATTASAATAAAASSEAADIATVTTAGGAVTDASSRADATGQVQPIGLSLSSATTGTSDFLTPAVVSVGVVGEESNTGAANASASATVGPGVSDGDVDGGRQQEQDQVHERAPSFKSMKRKRSARAPADGGVDNSGFWCPPFKLIKGIRPYNRGFNREFQRAYRGGLIFDTLGAIPKPTIVPDTLAPAGGGGWDSGIDGLLLPKKTRRQQQQTTNGSSSGGDGGGGGGGQKSKNKSTKNKKRKEKKAKKKRRDDTPSHTGASAGDAGQEQGEVVATSTPSTRATDSPVGVNRGPERKDRSVISDSGGDGKQIMGGGTSEQRSLASEPRRGLNSPEEQKETTSSLSSMRRALTGLAVSPPAASQRRQQPPRDTINEQQGEQLSASAGPATPCLVAQVGGNERPLRRPSSRASDRPSKSSSPRSTSLSYITSFFESAVAELVQSHSANASPSFFQSPPPGMPRKLVREVYNRHRVCSRTPSSSSPSSSSPSSSSPSSSSSSIFPACATASAAACSPVSRGGGGGSPTASTSGAGTGRDGGGHGGHGGGGCSPGPGSSQQNRRPLQASLVTRSTDSNAQEEEPGGREGKAVGNQRETEERLGVEGGVSCREGAERKAKAEAGGGGTGAMSPPADRATMGNDDAASRGHVGLSTNTAAAVAGCVLDGLNGSDVSESNEKTTTDNDDQDGKDIGLVATLSESPAVPQTAGDGKNRAPTGRAVAASAAAGAVAVAVAATATATATAVLKPYQAREGEEGQQSRQGKYSSALQSGGAAVTSPTAPKKKKSRARPTRPKGSKSSGGVATCKGKGKGEGGDSRGGGGDCGGGGVSVALSPERSVFLMPSDDEEEEDSNRTDRGFRRKGPSVSLQRPGVGFTPPLPSKSSSFPAKKKRGSGGSGDRRRIGKVVSGGGTACRSKGKAPSKPESSSRGEAGEESAMGTDHGDKKNSKIRHGGKGDAHADDAGASTASAASAASAASDGDGVAGFSPQSSGRRQRATAPRVFYGDDSSEDEVLRNASVSAPTSKTTSCGKRRNPAATASTTLATTRPTAGAAQSSQNGALAITSKVSNPKAEGDGRTLTSTPIPKAVNSNVAAPVAAVAARGSHLKFSQTKRTKKSASASASAYFARPAAKPDNERPMKREDNGVRVPQVLGVGSDGDPADAGGAGVLGGGQGKRGQKRKQGEIGHDEENAGQNVVAGESVGGDYDGTTSSDGAVGGNDANADRDGVGVGRRKDGGTKPRRRRARGCIGGHGDRGDADGADNDHDGGGVAAAGGGAVRGSRVQSIANLGDSAADDGGKPQAKPPTHGGGRSLTPTVFERTACAGRKAYCGNTQGATSDGRGGKGGGGVTGNVGHDQYSQQQRQRHQSIPDHERRLQQQQQLQRLERERHQQLVSQRPQQKQRGSCSSRPFESAASVCAPFPPPHSAVRSSSAPPFPPAGSSSAPWTMSPRFGIDEFSPDEEKQVGGVRPTNTAQLAVARSSRGTGTTTTRRKRNSHAHGAAEEAGQRGGGREVSMSVSSGKGPAREALATTSASASMARLGRGVARTELAPVYHAASLAASRAAGYVPTVLPGVDHLDSVCAAARGAADAAPQSGGHCVDEVLASPSFWYAGAGSGGESAKTPTALWSFNPLSQGEPEGGGIGLFGDEMMMSQVDGGADNDDFQQDCRRGQDNSWQRHQPQQQQLSRALSGSGGRGVDWPRRTSNRETQSTMAAGLAFPQARSNGHVGCRSDGSGGAKGGGRDGFVSAAVAAAVEAAVAASAAPASRQPPLATAGPIFGAPYSPSRMYATGGSAGGDADHEESLRHRFSGGGGGGGGGMGTRNQQDRDAYFYQRGTQPIRVSEFYDPGPITMPSPSTSLLPPPPTSPYATPAASPTTAATALNSTSPDMIDDGNSSSHHESPGPVLSASPWPRNAVGPSAACFGSRGAFALASSPSGTASAAIRGVGSMDAHKVSNIELGFDRDS